MEYDFTIEIAIRAIYDALMFIFIIYLCLKMERLTSHTKKLLDIIEKREQENKNDKIDQQ